MTIKYLKQIECAVILGISRQRVGQLLDAGKLPHVVIAGTRLVQATALAAFAKRRDIPR